jgi:hypothetical protein
MAISFSEAKKISIIEYLDRLGFEPVKMRGSDHWYHSPFRHDRNPSLKVNDKLNVWYDHGSGEGGTLIDLGAKLHQCSLHEFLNKLEGNVNSFPVHEKREHLPDNKLEIIDAFPLHDPDLKRYLEGRGITRDVSEAYCKEVQFTIAKKIYNAVGFENRSGGFELRNRWFKGSSSPKDVSLLTSGSSFLSVMEGFIDFLSAKSSTNNEIISTTKSNDFLILNSLSLLIKNKSILESYRDVSLFFDNDQAGRNAKSMLTENGFRFKDASSIYANVKDVNDFVSSESRIQNKSNRAKRIKH